MQKVPGRSTQHQARTNNVETAGPTATPGKRTLVESQIMRSASSASPVAAPEGISNAFAAATSGPAAQVPFRADMERSFGEDFSSVRAHLGGGARPGLDALNANAAAQGETVAFGTASPDRALVAHELTHVVQQRRGGGGWVLPRPQGR
jgi:hypothetical protein